MTTAGQEVWRKLDQVGHLSPLDWAALDGYWQPSKFHSVFFEIANAISNEDECDDNGNSLVCH